MSLFDPVTQALELSIHGLGLRQKALAQNLANINTPGYRRVDVHFRERLGEALDRARRQRLSRLEVDPFKIQIDGHAAVRADGNSVDVDQEAAAVSENALEYQTAVSLLALRRRGLETVIRGNL